MSNIPTAFTSSLLPAINGYLFSNSPMPTILFTNGLII
jgi:hypothetical protein